MVFIDERTESRTMLHYARVLVELDLRKEKEYGVMYERSGHCATVSIGYEQHPHYCSNCETLGHASTDCTRGKKTQPKHNSYNLTPSKATTQANLGKQDSEWIQ